MKHMKKALSLLLALVLVLGLSSTAWAADTLWGEGPLTDAGSITINNAGPGERYDLYQIMYLDSYDAATDNYSYKLTNDWKGILSYSCEVPSSSGTGTTTTTVGEYYLQESTGGYVTWRGEASAVEFSKVALAYAKDTSKGISALAIKTAAVADAGTEVSVQFTNLKLGYYLVDTTLGSLCILDTTNPNVAIEEKNTVPTNNKQVQENSQVTLQNGGWGTNNDANIGEVVRFRSQIDNIKSGSRNLVFHDKMENGLTLLYDSSKEYNNESIDCPADKEDYLLLKLTNRTDVADRLLVEGADGDYTITVLSSSTDSDGCTFHITFTDHFYNSLKPEKMYTIGVNYAARLNENAVIASTGNPNTCHLTYGELNHSTGDSKTVTKTFELPVFKYTGTIANPTPLDNTKFTLRPNTEGSSPLKFVLKDDGIGKGAEVTEKDAEGNTTTKKLDAQAVYRLATDAEIAEDDKKEDAQKTLVTTIVTNGSGKFTLQGLDSSTYVLTETEPRPGYNKLTSPITVSINTEGKISYNDGVNSVSGATQVSIQNNTGNELPSTGGMGTTIFYIIGGILVAAAVVLLVTKKRMSNADK